MKRFRRPAALTLLLVTATWLAISWIEAEKEVHILCGQFAPGVRRSDVIRQLETGHYLRYTVEGEGDAQSVTAYSLYNLRTTHCSVYLEDGVVLERRYHD